MEQALLERTEEGSQPHYNGFPAVLVRLAKVSVGELRALLVQAWRCQAPVKARKAFDAGL